MRWKLANGNVIASTKQPVQWKDFDRIVIEDDYDSAYLIDNGTFEEVGEPPVTGDIEFTIRLYNPSTYTVRKSYHKPGVQFQIGPTRIYGRCGGRYSENSPDIISIHKGYEAFCKFSNLNYGYTYENYIYPRPGYIHTNWSREITPFTINCYDYDHDEYTQPFEGRLVIKTGGGKYHDYKILKKFNYSINYKIR